MNHYRIHGLLLLAGGVLAACGGTDNASDEAFRAAVPSVDVLTVTVPATAQMIQGLSTGETGTHQAALVGEPAEFHVSTYAQARAINAFGQAVGEILDAIIEAPPTLVAEDSAVWGPFRGEGEPVEVRLSVLARSEPELHYVWQLEGRRESGDDFVGLAAGAFRPDGTEDDKLGEGWFAVDFDQLRALDPSEEGRGQVLYAYARNEDGVAVRMFAKNGDEEAAYAFGVDNDGFGYVLFFGTDDVHNGEDGQTAEENLVVRARWTPSGPGRADVLAAGGDLGASFVQVSQCWDDTFVSRYESFSINGAVVVEQGDSATCAFDGSWPAQDDLPDENDLLSPFPAE